MTSTDDTGDTFIGRHTRLGGDVGINTKAKQRNQVKRTTRKGERQQKWSIQGSRDMTRDET